MSSRQQGDLGAKERLLRKKEEAQVLGLPLPLTSWVTLDKSLSPPGPQVSICPM